MKSKQQNEQNNEIKCKVDETLCSSSTVCANYKTTKNLRTEDIGRNGGR